ncbi:histidinol dehydrogenase [Facilibium subflavum]|uniref:histidinol dehydrogenase n=1 Tax=Facilibium subflavum TaxID=2219058 RepID=UPI000E650949|nr:histidinol dehydrogenase [Facilibium subflavum]
MIDCYKVDINEKSTWQNLLKRAPQINSEQLTRSVKSILNEVKYKGDKALFDYTYQWDKCLLESLDVSKKEIAEAYNQVSVAEIDLVKDVIARIQNYHQVNKPRNTIVDSGDGICCHKVFKAIESIGLYVPGGSAPLISTLIMLAIPAKVAGCTNISVCTPVNENGQIHPLLLVTADICGVDVIYKLGGAQAIAAMAYGTQSIKKVDKIYGPGNSWVTKAKGLVAIDMDGAAIDMPAGPSEVLVIADENAHASFVAADLLAQAEHGTDSQAILITDSEALAKSVKKEIQQFVSRLSRVDIIQAALKNSAILLVNDLDSVFKLANIYAPEHLILQIKNAQKHVDKVINAGAVFVGRWAAEALGDYVTGSNHVLPTYGYARSFSGLSTIDFMKATSVQYVTKAGLSEIGNLAATLAQIEGLGAHKLAVDLRLEYAKEALCLKD